LLLPVGCFFHFAIEDSKIQRVAQRATAYSLNAGAYLDEAQMTVPSWPENGGYENLYEDFDSPLAKQIRCEAYGEDIGQHSWVTAEELREDISRLELSRESNLLDLGCGPGGPLAFVIRQVACRGCGIDASAQAIAAGRVRAAALGLDKSMEFREGDLNQDVAFRGGHFDAVMSLDVILHLRDRLSWFRKIARILKPDGKFLFTDAGVLLGAISDEEVKVRSTYGPAQFVPVGFNENILRLAGFRVLDCTDRTASLLKNAAGRLTARIRHRAELSELEGEIPFQRQNRYLATVIDLSQRGVLTRWMYLAELG
jgi:SAM-dependent methyltransferase